MTATHPHPGPYFLKAHSKVGGMSETQTRRRRPGRPSKGPRRYINVPVPESLGDRIEELSDLTGKPMNQLLLEVIQRHEDELDPSRLELPGAQTAIELRSDRMTA